MTVVQPPVSPRPSRDQQLSLYPSSCSSSVLHLLLWFRWYTSSRRTPFPTLRGSLLWVHRHPSTLIHQSCRIWVVLKGYCESANGADNVFVAVDAKGDDWNKAQGKPRFTLEPARRIVSLGFVSKEQTMGEREAHAMLTLEKNLLVAWERGGEHLLSACEYKTHIRQLSEFA